MKDLFDFNEHTEDAKNDLLLQMMVGGGGMSKGRADNLGYEFYKKKFGEKEMRSSELVWYAFSERMYSELRREGLIWGDEKWMYLTDEGKKAVRLTYTKYLFRKKVDKAFKRVEFVARFIKKMSTMWKWVILIVSLLASSVMRLIGLL